MLQALAFLVLPMLVLRYSSQIKILAWLGPVGVCYAIGILFANQPLFEVDNKISMQLSELAVPMAICLLLFSTDINGWLKESRKTLISFALMILSVMLTSLSVTFFLKDRLPEAWKLAGMLVGVYIGGTTNLSAIGLGLGVNEKSFILLNAADVFIGGLYFLFLLTVGTKWMTAFLKQPDDIEEFPIHPEDTLQTFIKAHFFRELGLLLALGLVGLGISYLLTQALMGAMSVPTFLMILTTYALILSQISTIRKFVYSYDVGHYFLLVFCLAMGSMAKTSDLVSGSEWYFIYVFCVMVVSALTHLILCRLFKIDGHTALITSVAGIYGPAFIPPIAAKLKNKKMVILGISTGLIGYALGTYCGFLLAYLAEKLL